MSQNVERERPVADVVIEPRVFDVYRPVTVRVRVRPARDLREGSVVACQLPDSFLAHRVSQSHTQRLQTGDPSAPHHVNVSLAGTRPASASFDVEIAARELITDVRGNIRHGQRVLATVRGGGLPTGSEVEFTFSRMHTPWVANQTEYFYVGIDGEAIEPWPTFTVRPGPAAWQRLIVPSCARPGEPFRVLLVTLDEYDKVSSTRYSGVALAKLTEFQENSIPVISQSEGDQLSDYLEIIEYGSDPRIEDTDRDTIPDGEEVNPADPGVPPNPADPAVPATSPVNADTDGDGLSDSEDDDPVAPDEKPTVALTSPSDGQVLDDSEVHFKGVARNDDEPMSLTLVVVDDE